MKEETKEVVVVLVEDKVEEDGCSGDGANAGTRKKVGMKKMQK